LSSTITIDGATVTCPTVVPRRLTLPLGRVPTFVFESPGGPLPTGAYPYLNKEVVVAISGTDRFKGDVVRCEPRFSASAGWTRVYTCLSLRNRGDWIKHSDSNNGINVSIYNALRDAEIGDWLASRAGKTVGEILTDVLTMTTNATALDALDIGAYTSLSPPTLPSATTTDLATLTRVLPGPIRFGGEKFLTAVEAFLSVNAPNHRLVVLPDGTLRFLDLTSLPTSATLTLGTDPVDPPDLSRDLTECYSAVEVWGEPIASVYEFRLSITGTDRGLSESPFAYDSLTVAQAKAAFKPSHHWQPDCVDEGTCTCPSTTTVTVTSSNATYTWSADFWNQEASKRYGVIQLQYTLGNTITMYDQRLVVDCTSLSAGGTSTITLDRALPHTNFNRYSIRGRRGGKQNVYTTYALPSWAGAKVAPQSSYPYPFRNASGNGVQMTTSAMGLVIWSANGNSPYFEVGVPIEVDPDAGTITFPTPTYMMVGNREPTDVRAFVPIYNAENYVRKPASSYEGTGYSVDGVQRVLPVTVRSWRDPANATGMASFAQDILDSVKTPIVEGVVTYHGLYGTAMAPGVKLNIAADGYTTGWESAALPVLDTLLEWTGPDDAVSYRTTLQVSTRRAHYTESAYLQPERTGAILDFGNAAPIDLSGMGGNSGSIVGQVLSNAANLQNNWLQDQAARATDALSNLDAGAVGAFQDAFQGMADVQDGAFRESKRLLREGTL
jgi:hypothetical protein